MDLQKHHQDQTSKGLYKKDLADDALNLFFQKKSILTHYSASLTISGTLGRPSIRKLAISHGEAPIIVFITGLLREFLSFVPNGLNAEEIVLYADKILAHRPTWTTADLVLCFKNGMDGKYGIVKYHWKWNTFVEWAEKFDQEKENFFFEKHEEKKKQDPIDILKHIPSHILDKFQKIKSEEDGKKNMSDIIVPDEIINQGIKAVDQWIEKFRIKKINGEPRNKK